jgi:ChrR Cupin-like domain
MNDDERELLAAEYVLGTLDGEDREAFLRRLADDDDLQARITAWEQRFFDFEQGSGAIAPPDRLWQAIEAELGPAEEDRPALTVVRADERRWQPLGPGVDWLPLYSEPSQGWHCFLLRLAAGARLPPHVHVRAEECLMLDGDIRIGAERFGAGDYVVAPAGSRHPRMISEGGAVAYLRAAIGGTT